MQKVPSNDPDEQVAEQPEENIFETEEIEGIVKCEECNLLTPGIITTEIPVFVYLGCMILLFFIGKYTFIIAPVVFLVLKNQIRRCPECQMIIESKLLFSIKSTHDAYFTLKCNDMIVVIHKKWAMIFLCVVGLLTASFISYEEFIAPSDYDPLRGFEERIASSKVHSFTWETYLEDCGSLRVLRNQFRADDEFDKKYKYNLVEWSGFYAGHDEYLIDNMNVQGIKIKMEPTDTNTLADLLVTKVVAGSQEQFDSELKVATKGDLTRLDDNFKPGEQVTLLMRIYHIGNEEIPHLVEVKTIKRAAGNRQVSEEGLKQIEPYKFTSKRIFNRGK